MWKWTYNFPDDEETSDQWKEIWIDKKSHAVSKMVYSTNMLGENQYNQWDMSSLAFSKVTPSGLKARFEKIEAGYTLEDFKERPKEETEPLAIGTPVPALTGTLYPNEEA